MDNKGFHILTVIEKINSNTYLFVNNDKNKTKYIGNESGIVNIGDTFKIHDTELYLYDIDNSDDLPF